MRAKYSFSAISKTNFHSMAATCHLSDDPKIDWNNSKLVKKIFNTRKLVTDFLINVLLKRDFIEVETSMMKMI